jgi:hypothetical protein
VRPRPLEPGEAIGMQIHLAMYTPDIARMATAINSTTRTSMIRRSITAGSCTRLFEGARHDRRRATCGRRTIA